MDKEFLYLQQSESVVSSMSATIFAALIAQPELRAQGEDLLVEHAVAIAVKLAKRTEEIVESDEEWVKKHRGSAFLAG